mgnify:CR=1 FL=1
MFIGDIVARKSYGADIYFRITGADKNNEYTLCGLDYRLKVTAPAGDLTPVTRDNMRVFKRLFQGEIDRKVEDIFLERSQIYPENMKIQPGKVLHLDSDREYLNMCLSLYKRLNMPSEGERVDEKEQPQKITELLIKHMPDILVITGHDSLRNSDMADNPISYKSSGFFIDTVKNARLFNPSKDSLIIVAGACQSYYEALIDAGANVIKLRFLKSCWKIAK